MADVTNETETLGLAGRVVTGLSVEEGEGWLSGEVVEKKHAGWGVFTAVPRSVFDAVRNFAGLGDQQVRSITDDFEPQDLVTR